MSSSPITRLKRMPTEAEVIELLEYINTQSIYIVDDYLFEMENEFPNQCESADKLMKDLCEP